MGTVPSFRTWVVGELVTASYMNTNIRDAGNFLITSPLFAGRQTVAQSIANGGSGTAVSLDTEDIDSDNGHSTVTNTSRYTAQTAGWYRYGGGAAFAANATGTRVVWLTKNSVIVPGSATQNVPNASLGTELTLRSSVVSMSVNDFVEVVAFQTSGGALNTIVSGNEVQSCLSAQWVHT